jgi:hypothetical protein
VGFKPKFYMHFSIAHALINSVNLVILCEVLKRDVPLSLISLSFTSTLFSNLFNLALLSKLIDIQSVIKLNLPYIKGNFLLFLYPVIQLHVLLFFTHGVCLLFPFHSQNAWQQNGTRISAILSQILKPVKRLWRYSTYIKQTQRKSSTESMSEGRNRAWQTLKRNSARNGSI